MFPYSIVSLTNCTMYLFAKQTRICNLQVLHFSSYFLTEFYSPLHRCLRRCTSTSCPVCPSLITFKPYPLAMCSLLAGEAKTPVAMFTSFSNSLTSDLLYLHVVVIPELRAAEAHLQLFDSLENLNRVVNDIFGQITARVRHLH